jgi:VanZ family protein
MWILPARSLHPDFAASGYMRTVIRIVPMIVIMGTIFLLSHQPGDSLPLPTFPGADKFAHMFAYAILAVTVLWFLGKQGAERLKVTALLTVCFCLLYGMSDEFHQSFIPYRSVSVLDIVADTAGAALIAALWFSNEWIRQKVSVM